VRQNFSIGLNLLGGEIGNSIQDERNPSLYASKLNRLCVAPRHRACYVAHGKWARVDRLEAVMKPIINLESELLFDRSRIVSPYVRLLLAAAGGGGQRLAVGERQHASVCDLSHSLGTDGGRPASAAGGVNGYIPVEASS
jgi:hypothetical protein